MFPIKNVQLNGDILSIIDKNNKKYSVSVNNRKISSLLPLASNSSQKLKKNIRYFEKCSIICLLCLLICTCEVLIPIIQMKSYAEVFVLCFGGLGLASVSLAVAFRLAIKWLKKYSINNEYWEEIYHIIKGDTNERELEKTKEKIYQNRNVQVNNDYTKSNEIELDNGTTYSYSKKQIIQDYTGPDKIKTYKRY